MNKELATLIEEKDFNRIEEYFNLHCPCGSKTHEVSVGFEFWGVYPYLREGYAEVGRYGIKPCLLVKEVSLAQIENIKELRNGLKKAGMNIPVEIITPSSNLQSLI